MGRTAFLYEDKLTKREKEIIDAIVKHQCFTRKSLMNFFKISDITVSTHLVNIYDKKRLPYNNLAALVWDYYKNYIEDLQQVDKREINER